MTHKTVRAGRAFHSRMAFRDDLIALSARHDALATEVAHKTRELEESRRLLDQATARARLPVLDNVRVASPCSADWSQMTGDDRTRHCGECKKNVYNLSGMTRDEAEALLIDRNGDLCVRYYQRSDGTILLADCAVGARRKRRRRLAVIAGGAAALLAAAGVAGTRTRIGAVTCPTNAPRMGQMVMGEIAVAPAKTAPEPPPSVVQLVAPPPSMQLPPENPAVTPSSPPALKMGKLVRAR